MARVVLDVVVPVLGCRGDVLGGNDDDVRV